MLTRTVPMVALGGLMVLSASAASPLGADVFTATAGADVPQDGGCLRFQAGLFKEHG